MLAFIERYTVKAPFSYFFFFFSSRRRHTRSDRDWSSDVCSSDLHGADVHTVLEQVALQVLQALQVLVELARLAVGHEHDAVGALEHEAAGGVEIGRASCRERV